MKTQIRKPSAGKSSYSEEYKKHALELWRASGRSAAKVVAELGIRAPLRYRWVRAEREPSSKNAGVKSVRSAQELEAEIHRLRKENAKRYEAKSC
jgi:transposase-like protein